MAVITISVLNAHVSLIYFHLLSKNVTFTQVHLFFFLSRDKRRAVAGLVIDFFYVTSAHFFMTKTVMAERGGKVDIFALSWTRFSLGGKWRMTLGVVVERVVEVA